MKRWLNKYKKAVFFILLCYSIILLCIAPPYYNRSFNNTCTFSYIGIVWIYFLCCDKKNYMDFDTMFIISFFLVSFFFSTFIFPINPQYLLFFQQSSNESVIHHASSLSLTGMTAYMCGGIYCRKKKRLLDTSLYRYKKISTKYLFIMSLLSFLLFIVLGGYAALKGTYAGEGIDKGGIYSYFSIICYVCIFAMIIIWFMNSYHISKSKFQWSVVNRYQLMYIGVYILMLLLAGSRGKVLNIVLMSFGLYAYMYRPFSLCKVVSLSIIGMVFMFGIMVYRSGLNVTGDLTAAELGSDLIATNSNTYVAINMVDNKGLTYGYSMLGYILGTIPFCQNIVQSLFPIPPNSTTSAMIITQEVFGTVDYSGTGTTITADIYLAFGDPGIILFMWFLGWFIHYSMNRGKENIYDLAIYGIMMGVSVYLTRAEFFYPARTILWTLLAIYLNSHLKIHHLPRKTILI